jgi:hypothetical protein
MSSELEIRIIDKIESQVKHCFRFYEDHELEDKLIDLCREWFFKGFTGGITHEREQQQKEK